MFFKLLDTIRRWENYIQVRSYNLLINVRPLGMMLSVIQYSVEKKQETVNKCSSMKIKMESDLSFFLLCHQTINSRNIDQWVISNYLPPQQNPKICKVKMGLYLLFHYIKLVMRMVIRLTLLTVVGLLSMNKIKTLKLRP